MQTLSTPSDSTKQVNFTNATAFVQVEFIIEINNSLKGSCKLFGVHLKNVLMGSLCPELHTSPNLFMTFPSS